VKRHRQSLRRRDRNRARKTQTRSAVRNVRELIDAGSKDEAQAAVREAASILDRAARRRAIHPNKAARQKSRLMRAASSATATTASSRKRTSTKRTTRSKAAS
jgi:small subunit ribosomal protein S20